MVVKLSPIVALQSKHIQVELSLNKAGKRAYEWKNFRFTMQRVGPNKVTIIIKKR